MRVLLVLVVLSSLAASPGAKCDTKPKAYTVPTEIVKLVQQIVSR